MQGSEFGLRVSVLGLSVSVWGFGLGVEGLGFRTASRTRGSDDLRIGTFQGLGFRVRSRIFLYWQFTGPNPLYHRDD